LIYGYIEALFAVASRATACIALHQVSERCARWLLETHDRVDSNRFELKQEFLGRMLAVSRPTVSVAQGTLQAAGTIQYRRGKITIVDREALEEASCSCYEVNRRDYSRLVPLG
jgi:CRP-like cAMP-binding protein